jgi:hypothetical protein
MRPNVRHLLIAGLALFLAGCGTTRIGRILDEPNRFHNHTVRVDGRVDRSFGAVIAGVYQVDDGSGKIYVISNRPVPRKGARVSVKGRVMNGITIGARSFGTAIQEQDHRVQQRGQVLPRYARRDPLGHLHYLFRDLHLLVG